MGRAGRRRLQAQGGKEGSRQEGAGGRRKWGTVRGCPGLQEGQKEVWARRGQEGWGEGRGAGRGWWGRWKPASRPPQCPVPRATLKDDRPQDLEQPCVTMGLSLKEETLKNQSKMKF